MGLLVLAKATSSCTMLILLPLLLAHPMQQWLLMWHTLDPAMQLDPALLMGQAMRLDPAMRLEHTVRNHWNRDPNKTDSASFP